MDECEFRSRKRATMKASVGLTVIVPALAVESLVMNTNQMEHSTAPPEVGGRLPLRCSAANGT